MQVVAILGGLGSQMFKYAFYIALKEKSQHDCYIDTSFYNVPRQGMWNGYELEKIFNVTAPDINTMIDRYSNASGWYPARAIQYMTAKEKIIYYDRGIPVFYGKGYPNYNILQKIMLRYYKQRKKYIERHRQGPDVYPEGYAEIQNSAYFDEFDHRSDKYFNECQNLVRQAYEFPEFSDRKNSFYGEKMLGEISIAVHIRRSDHMFDNKKLFERGFFKRAVNHIKKLTDKEKRCWYFFSDDISWCITNKDELGFDDTDNVVPVDWNRTEESYKDMQLMSYCKHNIIPISSFSWWGYYLSKHEKKIVCAPHGYWTDAEYHF